MSSISDINWLFQNYYSDNPKLREIVTTHSEQVAKKAIQICNIKRLPLDTKEVFCAAMLHDIGVVNCNAPGIYAFGTLPYLCHGMEGAKILYKHGLSQFTYVCATHTGSGISASEIIKNNLPLPNKNFMPETLLEKLICYADKFYSKSKDLYHEKNIDEIISAFEKHGEETRCRFLDLHNLFS